MNGAAYTSRGVILWVIKHGCNTRGFCPQDPVSTMPLFTIILSGLELFEVVSNNNIASNIEGECIKKYLQTCHTPYL